MFVFCCFFFFFWGGGGGGGLKIANIYKIDRKLLFNTVKILLEAWAFIKIIPFTEMGVGLY